MRKIYLSISVGVFLMYSTQVSSQTYSSGHESAKSDVNFTELANWEKAHPKPVVPKKPMEEDELENFKPFRPDPDPALIKNRVNVFEKISAGAMPVSPAPADTFQSTGFDGASIPPDTHGAVNATYCVTVDNAWVRIQNRTGGAVSSVSLNSFWTGTLPAGTGTYDPRIHFDPIKNVWIFVTDAINFNNNHTSTLLVAVSTTSSPTGTWHKYAITIDATNTWWLDYPNVGFNSQWVVITGNMFPVSMTGSGNGTWVYVINYANMIAGTGAPFVKITQPSAFSIAPALCYDASSNMFGIEEYHDYNAQLRLWKISGTVGSPTMTAIAYPHSAYAGWNNTSFANSTTNYGNDFAPQSGTTQKVQTNDDRMNNLTERNGKLWFAHNVFYPYSTSANPTRCSAMWWETDTAGTIVQNGLIDDPTNATFYAFPTIAVNSIGDALIGLSRFSATTHPAAAYVYRSHTDPTDSMRKPYIYRHGQNSYYQTFGGPKNRWGDYSGTCVDPSNNLDFWTIQECVMSTANSWDTWWGHLKASTVETENIVENNVQVTIVPNPNNGNYDVSFGEPYTKSFTVRVTDMTGRIVYHQQFENAPDGKVSVKLANLSAGMYLTSIIPESGVAINKMIEIQK